MAQKGIRISRVINGGSIPKRNDTLNQVYANMLNRPVLVTARKVTSLGSITFAFFAAGEFAAVEEAQDAICPHFITFNPQPNEVARAESSYLLLHQPYFALGTPAGRIRFVGKCASRASLPEATGLQRLSRSGLSH